MARAKAFLGLWLPAMAVLLAGLWRAWQTGQADPWDWSIAVAGLMALIGFLLANRTIVMLIWIALGVVAPVLVFCAMASGQLRLLPSLGLALTALLPLVAAAWLRHPPILRGRMAAMGMIVAAGAILYFGPPPSLAAADTRPKLAVLTGLPLFWDEMGPAGTGLRDAPIITVLRTRFTVLPLDDPRDLPGTGARRLLIAQPRALAPEQLVAIDTWVRAGGTALVLADPLLRWPSDLALGDRRRAPTSSLLQPLLTHWGVAPDRFESREVRQFLADDRLLTLSGAWLPHGRTMTARTIGRGTLLLIGDADLIDDRLWLADPAQPLNPRSWIADTPAALLLWLGAAAPAPRSWMRTPADVMLALRWAILVGTSWAMVGGALLWARFTDRDEEQKVKTSKGTRGKSV